MKHLFLLREDVTFLNFGSFGACPRMIFDDYIQWEYLLEEEPVRFIAHDGINYLNKSRLELSKFINCLPEDLILVPNPTHAINILAKNLNLKKGEEILTTNLEYGAMDYTWQYYCDKANIKYVRQNISLPIESKEKFLEEFWKGYSEHTKAIFISHITSTTGLILPVEEICREAKKRGLITIVDGAHVPGHIALDLSNLQADFYTGACHKWLMTPKGCSFLYVKKEYQDDLDPLIISWGYKIPIENESQYFNNHQFNGTRDFSAYLTIPKAIEFRQKYDWDGISAICRKTTLEGAKLMADFLNTSPLAPLTKDFYGQMCSLPIKCQDPVKLNSVLFEKYKIEIPVMRHDDKVFIRFSIQAFNDLKDIHRLIWALSNIEKETNLFSR